MQMKKLCAALAFVGAFSPVMAAEQSAVDLNAAFASFGDSAQVVVLSEQEMKDTQGAWVPQAVGAIGGLTGYGFSCGIAGNCTWAGAGLAGVSGALNPISGIWGFNTAIGTGIVQGVGSRYGLW